MINSIILGDCLEKLKELPENSVDSIVTDPPYELGFMGKSWDNTGIANNPEMWKECLRVLKPGGHLLAFSGTRTYHRMASAIEDAGFEVRDMIEWVYSTGFPKSLNIGKTVDKLQGNEREVVSKKQFADGTFQRATARAGIYSEKKGQAENTKGTSEWEGWGTALKPAHEPICMARKPLAEKTVSENCLKYGTGGINIDESRVDFGNETDKRVGTDFVSNGGDASNNKNDNQVPNKHYVQMYKEGGRFPANLIHDGSDEVKECFPETNKSRSGGSRGNGEAFFGNRSGFERGGIDDNGGNASRFFKSIIYQAKASKSERNKGCEGLEEKQKAGAEFRPNHQEKANNGETGNPFGRWNKVVNNHPTVKPIALMEYLIKMVTPKGGVVLDPFAGSGSTLVAAKENGFQYIGIEMTPEYIPIIEARLKNLGSKQTTLL